MAIGKKKAIELLKAGDRIFVTNPTPSIDGRERGPSYQMQDGGQALRPSAFAALKDSIELVGDGLFGADVSQSFRWRAEE